ncbi:MAG: PilZ domain-containing protein [Deltaproteobacteria bacterium]|nr:PilZ domain-containing protein [Deltaproteobacteria bacterium]
MNVLMAAGFVVLNGFLLQAKKEFNLEMLRPDGGGGGMEASSTTRLVLGLSALAVVLAFAGYAFVQNRRAKAGSSGVGGHAGAGAPAPYHPAHKDEVDLDEKTRDLLVTFAGTENPAIIATMINSRVNFEQVVERYHHANPTNIAAAQINMVRHQLGFGFDNPRVPFNHTRMLAPGTKMTCILPLPKRKVSYTTTVVSIDENGFHIMPPQQHGKPVLVKKLHDLGFKITRQHDSEYSFSCHLLDQDHDGLGAVKMAHGTEIRKMLYRNAKRVLLDFPAEFSVIHRAKGAGGEANYNFRGRFLDISMGGVCVIVPPGGRIPEPQDTVIFFLVPAGIKDSLSTRVLSTEVLGETILLHLKFTALREMTRLKLSKLLDKAKDGRLTLSAQ